ncbi:substrate-binding domain-containing protein, partial [Oharaeibacter diazotrophicus]
MPRPLRIALLAAEEGPAGLWCPSAVACATLAVRELNEAGGLLGRPVALDVLNIGTSPAAAAEAAGSAIEVHGADAIVGMFPSYARRAVAWAVGRRVPFIYTPQFEGWETDPSVVTTGETSLELLSAATRWLTGARGARRFFLCGSDYVWPRSTFSTARRLIREAGGEVVGEEYLPLEGTDFDGVLDRIRAARADVVLPYFLGADAIAFNRAFAAAGLARRMLRFSSAIDETVLYGLDENATENLYVAAAYFSTLKSRRNGAFLERYHTAYGDSPPPPNGFGESCYEGVHCLAALAEAAGTLRPADLLRHVGAAPQRRTARALDDA